MQTDSKTATTLAILIDADNAQPAIIGGLLAEVARLGTPVVKRCYGDWSGTRLGGWKDALLEHSIHPVQQFNHIPGKNATDIALVIDAMDLLHAGHLSGFCLVSSDSDFTRLASRIRETGRKVYGFGEEKTLKAFRAACDQFFDTARYAPPKAKPKPQPQTTPQAGPPPPKRHSKEELLANRELMDQLPKAVEVSQDEEGWAPVTKIGQHLGNKYARKFGYAKLSDLIKETGLYRVEKQGNGYRVNIPNGKARVKPEAAGTGAETETAAKAECEPPRPEAQAELILLPPPDERANPTPAAMIAQSPR